jgi:uncharacterized protein YodC (DUF2158 family)
MSDFTFNPGDVVKHSAGGPRMTVEMHRLKPLDMGRLMPVQPAGVFCVWFDTANQVQRGRFEADHLSKVDFEGGQ